MRKNSKHYDRIKSLIKTLLNGKTEVFVCGFNQDVLLNALIKKSIAVYNVKKPSAKNMYLTISNTDSEKFFAISKEMCYNTKRVREYGSPKLLYYLAKNFCLFLGVTVFTAVTAFLGGFVFDYSYVGTGSIYSHQTEQFLTESGITRFSMFKNIDYRAIANDILKSNVNLSFVSVKKSGNRLVVELVESDKQEVAVKGDNAALLSTDDGVIETVKTYRGTTVAEEGQSVKKGEVIVDGVYNDGENVVKVSVIAKASIIVTKVFEYEANSGGLGEYYRALSVDSVEKEDLDVVSDKVTEIKDGNKFKYKIAVSYRKILSCG